MKNVAVFVGPSLPPEDRPAYSGLTYLPSARRGDVADAAHRYDAIVLIDGVFQEDLAPSPKEVLNATRTCAFFGAASLGALRAVECAPYGARPCGAIARWYAAGAIDGDDEVAVVFDPLRQRALSVPLVNVRYLLYMAQRRKLIDAARARHVLDEVRDVFYADRTWEDVLERVDVRERASFEALVRHADLKKLDARLAVRCAVRWTMRPKASDPKHGSGSLAETWWRQGDSNS